MTDIICSIITFNPEIQLLKKNIESIQNQVDKIIIIDNFSSNVDEIRAIVIEGDKLVLIQNKKNLGIAAALNQAFEYAKLNNYNWVLTLDQDSVCPNSFVNRLHYLALQEDRVGIMAPTIIDRNVGKIGHIVPDCNKYKEVRTCITSGALTNVSAWKEIGKFDEKMFIDSVDFEFCYRLRKYKYKVLQTNKVKLSHSIGDAKVRKFIFIKFKDAEHNAFRDFYIAQNNIYYPKKHKLILHLIRGNFRNLRLLFITLIYQKDKLKKVSSIIKGWINGYKI